MKTLFTFFISLIFCLSTFGQEVSVVSELVENGGSMYYFHGKKVARSSDGLLMVIWTSIGGTGGQINYSIYDDAFEIWSPAAPISAAGDRADKPALAADDLGNIHACWQERNTSDENYYIAYSKYDGLAWSTPIKVSVQDTNECEEASIEVDSDNNIWVVYNNDGAGEPDEFVYAVKSTDGGTTWSTEAEALSSSGLIDGSITNGRCTLAAGPGGKMVATWHNGQPWDSGRREISVNQYDGTSWSGEVMISDTTSADRSANWYPTVALDKNLNIYVIYHTNDVSTDPDKNRYLLVQKKSWDASWDESTTTIIHTETAGDMLGTSAVADEDGNIHLVFQKDIPEDTLGIDGNYYTYSQDGGETWEPAVKLGRVDHDGGYATLSNRIRKEYGIDIAFRESYSPLVNDQDTTSVIYQNMPYPEATGVSTVALPEKFELLRNYPNPFNPSTNLEYSIAKTGNVKLVVYDILGNKIKTIVNSEMQPGNYKAYWNGRDLNNKQVASGVYLITLQTITGIKTIKVELLK